MRKLKTCPFCGAEPTVSDLFGTFVINCEQCDMFETVDGYSCPSFNSVEELTQKWNARKNEAALETENKKLKKKLESIYQCHTDSERMKELEAENVKLKEEVAKLKEELIAERDIYGRGF